MLSRAFPLIAVLCLCSALHAQTDAPMHHQLYGGYSFLSNSFNGVPGSRQPLNGWDAALAFTPWHNLAFKIDTFGYRGTNFGAPQHSYFIMAGGQYNKRVSRETVYGEILVGDGGLNRYWGPNGLPGGTASFSTLVGGGLDTPVSRHFALRIGGDWQYANFALVQSVTDPVPYRIPGLPEFFGRITSGVVWGF